MMKPRYQDVRSDRIPEVETKDGARIRVVAGTVGDVRGAVTDIAADPVYLDVLVPPHSVYRDRIEPGHTAFAYVFEGTAKFPGPGHEEVAVEHPRLVVHDRRRAGAPPADLRQAAARADRALRSIRAEHARGDRTGARGPEARPLRRTGCLTIIGRDATAPTQ